MRVVIDARPALDPHRTGIGMYTAAVLRHVPAADPEGRYVAWYLDVRGTLTNRRWFRGWAPNLSERAARIPTRVFAPVSVRTQMPRLEWMTGRFDVALAPNFLPPPTASRGVVIVVHDLAFDHHPETAPHHNERWRELFERWLRHAAGVLVPSAATRGDLLRFHDVDADRIAVVPHGTDAQAFRPAKPGEIDAVKRRHGIDGRYVLFLGGLEPRKNLEPLVRAFGAMTTDDATLVIAGGEVRWAPGYLAEVERAVAALPASRRHRVVRTGYVSDDQRRALLSGAEVLAYPSRYEGFGFPVLEAFAANVPVLTSNVSSLPEVAGDAAILIDPDDAPSIAAGLDELLGDADLRNVLRAAGTTRVATFTWERCARQTVAALRAAHERVGGG